MSDELEAKLKKVEVELAESAPAWVVTFGDLMSLLLCFFVLLLSFSEMDKLKFKELAGSMEKAFGVQRKNPAWDPPKGMKMIFKDFDQEFIKQREDMEDPVEKIQKKAEIDDIQAGELLQFEIKTHFKETDSTDVKVGNKQVVLFVMGDATFAPGKAKLQPSIIPFLTKIGSVYQRTRGSIIISGHTDNTPVKGKQYNTNMELSIARAYAVADFFYKRTSIEPRRIATMGFGQYRPRGPNDTPENRKKNRRIEIILRTPTGNWEMFDWDLDSVMD
ncbi:MAG: OmpA family protein [Deltaproteobacteria bacterium]|nr:OmpA family protein [Deltaproteobacteria bacterium]